MSRSERAEREERKYTSARARAEKQSTGFTAPYLRLPEGVQLFKPKAGVMLLDIIPFVAGAGNPWADKGMLHWERTFWAHKSIGANSDAYLCPRMVSKERCPVCEARLALLRKGADGEDGAEDMVKGMSPQQRQLFKIVNRREAEKGVQIWNFSYHSFGKLLDARLRDSDEEDEWDKFFFLEEGLTLKVGFVEDSYAGHSFMKAETIDFKPRKEPYDEEMLEKVPCLDKLLIEEPYDVLKKIFLQMAPAKADEDEDEEPKSKKKRIVEDEDDEPKRKKKVADEEDDDDDVEPDDEDEPKSKKKKSSADDDDDDDAPPAKKKKVVDDEDEPADEDEEPKSKKKAVDEDDDWDDFEAPAKKKKVADEDEEEEPKSKKKKAADDDDEPDDDFEDDEPKSKKKKAVDEDDEDEEPKSKKKKVVEEDDDEPADDEDDRPRVRSADAEDEEDKPKRRSRR